jgi:hypothetical protein
MFDAFYHLCREVEITGESDDLEALDPPYELDIQYAPSRIGTVVVCSFSPVGHDQDKGGYEWQSQGNRGKGSCLWRI